jgi:hypothetical protein
MRWALISAVCMPTLAVIAVAVLTVLPDED